MEQLAKKLIECYQFNKAKKKEMASKYMDDIEMHAAITSQIHLLDRTVE